MREEIQTVLEEEGWTKTALTKMRKVDSFFRESLRLTGVNAGQSSLVIMVLSVIYAPLVWMLRVALKDFTFSDGTTIPAGQTVALPGYALQRDGVGV
jgi:hypothetical protein